MVFAPVIRCNAGVIFVCFVFFSLKHKVASRRELTFYSMKRTEWASLWTLDLQEVLDRAVRTLTLFHPDLLTWPSQHGDVLSCCCYEMRHVALWSKKFRCFSPVYYILHTSWPASIKVSFICFWYSVRMKLGSDELEFGSTQIQNAFNTDPFFTPSHVYVTVSTG